jgi:hypothetical protein
MVAESASYLYRAGLGIGPAAFPESDFGRGKIQSVAPYSAFSAGGDPLVEC